MVWYVVTLLIVLLMMSTTIIELFLSAIDKPSKVIPFLIGAVLLAVELIVFIVIRLYY